MDGAILRLNGVPIEDVKEESKMIPKKCPRCETASPATNSFCSRCVLATDINSALRVDVIRIEWNQNMNALVADPEVKDLLARKLEEMVATA